MRNYSAIPDLNHSRHSLLVFIHWLILLIIIIDVVTNILHRHNHIAGFIRHHY